SRIFNGSNDFKKCSPPLDEHSGGSEAVAFIDIVPDNDGPCRCGIKNSEIGVKVSLEYAKSQLPWLTNWQHWGKGEYVAALEPGTHPPVGQAKARKDGTLIQLNVGETKRYAIQLTVED